MRRRLIKIHSVKDVRMKVRMKGGHSLRAEPFHQRLNVNAHLTQKLKNQQTVLAGVRRPLLSQPTTCVCWIGSAHTDTHVVQRALIRPSPPFRQSNKQTNNSKE
jgi:hypothetical protein